MLASLALDLHFIPTVTFAAHCYIHFRAVHVRHNRSPLFEFTARSLFET